MLGFGAIGEAAISAVPDEIGIVFNVDNNSDNKSIIEIASIVDCALIERLRQYPEDLRIINRRKFEEIIAELFSGFGYEVELTKRTRDGGKDIIAIKRREVSVKYLIECKRPDPDNPVTVSTVRELLGVKVDDNATKAILATTTYLSPDAKIFVEKHQWELEAREFEGIKNWLDEYLSIKSKK
jgi:restriction system protein